MMIVIFFEFIDYKDAKNLGIFRGILGFIAARWVYLISSRIASRCFGNGIASICLGFHRGAMGL